MLQCSEVLTTAQMRAIESEAMASGQVTGLELMERAGRAVAGHIRLRWPKPGRATALCGPGNNGGDGYVIARHLHRAGWQVRVLGMDNTPGPDAAEMKRRWLQIGEIRPLTEDGLRQPGVSSDVYVDAIFGIGLTRPPEGEIADILARIGGFGGDWGYYGSRIVAVDCPSGLCLDSGFFIGQPREAGEWDVRAHLTVTFDSPKPGHLIGRGPECCGELTVADIGLRHWRERNADGRGQRWPRLQAIWPRFDIPDARWSFTPTLAKHSIVSPHKFNHGHALILAGDASKGGASQLSARAALRIGAGLVTIGTRRDAPAEHAGPPDALMRRPIVDAKDLDEALQDPRIKAVCIGPGCGVERAAQVLGALLPTKRTAILDADALTALSRDAALMNALHENCVLTPHGGEFARLFPDLDYRLNGPQRPALRYADYRSLTATFAEVKRYETLFAEWKAMPAYSKVDATRDAAARCGAVVLLKGPDTVIASPNGAAVIHSAFDVPWLATAGSGDVLAGIITGLLARGFQPSDAAATGTLIHASAARRFGPGLIADDLPEQIPGVFRDMNL